MELTRVDSKQLADACAAANKHLLDAIAILSPLLVALTTDQRKEILKPSVRFPGAARDMVRVAGMASGLARAAEFDPAAVTEDLENVEALAAVLQATDGLLQQLEDSRLAWLAEAYYPSLSLYRLAKEAARNDPKLAEIVAPLAEVFASRRRTRREVETE